jgi:hypothetical protein
MAGQLGIVSIPIRVVRPKSTRRLATLVQLQVICPHITLCAFFSAVCGQIDLKLYYEIYHFHLEIDQETETVPHSCDSSLQVCGLSKLVSPLVVSIL